MPVTNSSVFGDLKRSGPWQLPARSGWSSVFGDVVLDLREARVPAGEIAIDVRSVFGDVELLVPEGVLVEVRGRAFFGDVKQEAGLAASAGAPRIVLTGSTIFGDVRVRARRLRERLARAVARRRDLTPGVREPPPPRGDPARRYPSSRASSSASPRSSCARSASPTRS